MLCIHLHITKAPDLVERQQLLTLLLHQHVSVLVDEVVDVGQVGDHAGGQRGSEHIHVCRLIPVEHRALC